MLIVSTVPLIAALALVIANPLRFPRTIVLDGDEIRFPAGRAWRRVPVAEIAGVGLVKTPRWGWGVVVWRIDGRHVWCGGVGLSAGGGDPARSRLADVARQLHGYVLAGQAPDGPLSVMARQAHADLHPPEYLAVWDPATDSARSLS